MRSNIFDRPGRLFVRDLAAVLAVLFAVSALADDGSRNPDAGAVNAGAAAAGMANSEAVNAATDADASGPQPLSLSIGRLRNGDGHKARIDASAMPSSKQRVVLSRALGTGVFVYDADVDLYFDEDDDGFFSGLDVVFDVDTDFPVADVYARLYLSYEGGPWQAYFTTDLFAIFGSSGDDEYIVETELFSDYPRGYYDILIEIYDADDFLVAAFGPEDSSAVSILPLEDAGRDAPFVAAPVAFSSGGGGGAYGPVWMLLLSLVLIWRLVGGRRQAAICRPDTSRRRSSASTAADTRPASSSPDR